MIRIRALDTEGRTLSYVDYRNTVFEELYSPKDVVIVQVNTEEPIIPLGVNGFQIDFFGSSVKKGRVAFSRLDLLSRYGRYAEHMPYVGMLFTELRTKPIRRHVRILVVEDGEWGTGDCHGLCDPSLLWDIHHMDAEKSMARAEMIRRAAEDPELPEETRAAWRRLARRRFPPEELTVAQFRLVAPDQWIAKGTVRPAYTEYDLVLPQSSFKGNKPSLGKWEGQVVFGVREWARPLKVSIGYQILQWFSPSALFADLGVHIEMELEKVLRLHNDREALLDFIYDDERGAHSYTEELLLADRNELVTKTKTIQQRIRELTRNAWWHVATHANLSGVGLMAIPDDNLDYMTISTPDLPAGKLFMTRYPIRGAWDIRVVLNVPGNVLPGTVAMSHKTAKHFAGDFDGDLFVLWETTPFPTMTEEARSFNGYEVPKEKPRRNSEMTLENRRVVVERAITYGGALGRIANTITAAHANGRDDLIPELADMLQGAVDAIKYDTSFDPERLAEIREEIGDNPLWLQHHKQRWCWSKKAPVTGGEDTVSQLWDYIAGHFVPAENAAINTAYLVDLVPEPDEAVMRMARHMMRALYSGPIARAIREIRDQDERDEEIGRICESWRAWCQGESRIVDGKELPGLTENRDAFFHAIWRLSMSSGNSAVFVGFPDEVIKLLMSIEPIVASQIGLKTTDGGIIRWAVAKRIIRSLPEDRRYNLKEIARQRGWIDALQVME
ncbi:MAG: hypothetical protein J7M34_05875 [Anaerolineae bacterium]|nr:hypothetical protein [Anaerolineae bacterium]